MGKKSSGKNYTSKGERPNVSRRWTKSSSTPLERINNQIAAAIRNKNVVLTIPNPDPTQTNKRFIRVNSKDFWRLGPPPII